MKKTLFILIISVLSISVSFSQTRTVKGHVIDEENELVLIGVNVRLSDGTSIGMTNVDGFFKVEVPISETYLIIDYIGFQTQRLYIVCDDCVHKIAMSLDLNIDDEVISTCCGPRLPRIFSLNQNLSLNPIEVNNGVNIFPAFQSTTGVFVQSGALNENRISIRGIGANSPFNTRGTKVYFNEIPITSGEGVSILDDFDVSTFSEMYILKSPSISTFGASLGGGIFVNTDAPCDNYSEFTTDISVGSFGMWRNANNLHLNSNNTEIHIFQNTTQNAGYREQNNFTRQSFGINAESYRFSNHNFTFLGYYSEQAGELPSSLDQTTFFDSPQHAAPDWLATDANEVSDRLILGLHHTYYSDYFEGFKLKNTIFYNASNNEETRPSNFLNENSQNMGWSPALLFDYYDDRRIALQAGSDFFFENSEWQTFENENNGTKGIILTNNQATVQYTNLYAHAKLEVINKLMFSTGINANRTQFAIEDFITTDSIDYTGNHSYDWIVSPTLGMNYEMDYDTEFFINASHGYVMPTIEEMQQVDGSINLDLKPTTGWTYEVGSKGDFKNKIFYDVSVYRMNINNLIVPNRIDENTYVGLNAQSTQHDGVEFNVQYFPQNGIRAEVNYSFNNYTFKEYMNDGNDYSGNQLTGIPSNILNLSLQFKNYTFPLYGRLSYRYVDGMPIFDDNSLFTESYQLLDFKAGYMYYANHDLKDRANIFSLEDIVIDVYVGINNILDEQYASMIDVNPRSFNGNEPRMYYAGLPRNFYGGVRIVFDM